MILAAEPSVQAVVATYSVATPPAATVALSRVGPSGTPATVRAYGDAPAVPGVRTARDFEAPIGVALAYTLTARDAAGAVCETQTADITVPAAGDCDMWINDLARIGNTIQIVIESLADLEFPVPASVHEIIARRDPIVTSDVAHTPAFELSFLTETLDKRDRARALLGNGIPVLLRTPPQDGVGNLYLAVLGYREQRIVSPAATADRRFVVTGRQVARPDPALYAPIGVTTYAYVRDTWASYAALLAARASYDAVLYDWSGAQASDVVPWPPDDV